MANKRIFLSIGILFVLAGVVGYFLIERDTSVSLDNGEKLTNEQTVSLPVNNSPKPIKNEIPTIKADLYSNSPYYMPLFSMAEISNLSEKNTEQVNNLFNEAQGFYFFKQNGDGNNYTALLQNPIKMSDSVYSRHNLQLIKINKDGAVQIENLGYSGQIDETDNAVLLKNNEWEFDKSIEPYRPLKHISPEDDILETWNYDDNEPIKYEMKNAEGIVISMLKEFIDGDSGYRVEHTFYDPEGHTLRSVSINYEGANIKWFNYYDALNPDDCISVESEYEDGILKYEKIYNQDFKLVYRFEAKYSNAKMNELIQYDSAGNIIKKFVNQ